MKTGIRAGRSYKEQYSAYASKNSYAVNRELKLIRHLKNHPEDNVAQGALDSQRFVTYRRQKPRHKGVNTGLALIDKRTKKITERVKLEEPWLKSKPRHVNTIPEQMLAIGLISAIPKRFTTHATRTGRFQSRRANKSATPKSQ